MSCKKELTSRASRASRISLIYYVFMYVTVSTQDCCSRGEGSGSRPHTAGQGEL